ncbi:MAG: Gfo/Idh/MocA family oxidoreductase [Verrucomicrobiota bacterium]|jgi:predicted dehydrogenase
MNRRHFLKTSMSASAAFAAVPILGAEKIEKKYTTALLGTGWWGMNILRTAVASGTVKVVGMCDVDERQLKPAVADIEKLSGDKPRTYKDYRELIEKEKPEIVIVGTPDHWHPLMMIEAVKNGAHVYVEKPIGHTIMEGRAMVNAARKYDRVVQVGTHRRVSPHNVSGMKFLKEGKAGKIGMVRAFVHYGGGPEQPRRNTAPPKELDWDLWCGPAPLRPYNGNSPENPWAGGIHPRGFRNYLDYANGTLGDWGIHWMDQILWWTEEKYPRRISSTGGRHIKGPAVLSEDWQTSDAPDTQVAHFEFETFTTVWEHRQYAANEAEKGENVGCYFYGTEGTFHMAWQTGWTFYPADKRKPVLHEDAKLNEPDGQNIAQLWENFIECVKTGRRPVCDIEIAHRSTNMSLLGMIALRTGRTIEWDGHKERVVGDEYANTLLRRDYRKGWEYPRV